MPTMMTRPRIGRRGAVLALFGALLAAWGLLLALRGEEIQPSTAVADVLLGSLEAWGWVWVAAGVVCVVSALLPIGRDAVGFVAGLALLTLWGTSAAVDAFTAGDAFRSLSIALLCAIFALILGVAAGWPEVRR